MITHGNKRAGDRQNERKTISNDKEQDARSSEVDKSHDL